MCNKKMWKVIVVCFVALSCFCAMGMSTSYNYEVLNLEELEHDTLDIPVVDVLAVGRASGSVNTRISANSGVTMDTLPLDKDEIVTFNCTYTPLAASVDFGLIDSNNTFYYLTASNGSINSGIRINLRGNYTLAIRNNSGSTVSVTGYVNY